MTQITMRLATPADIPEMMRLTNHSATAAHWSKAQYEDIFDRNSPQRVAMVAQEADSLQGFLVGHNVADEWEIENIAIAGNARRHGLGTRLLEKFLDHARARGAHAVFLEVRESNRAARALYEKWSFEESGRRPRYYSAPIEDAIIYRHTFA
jgi:[ribosomal protein S18]-alanine N-acetyltransferase